MVRDWFPIGARLAWIVAGSNSPLLGRRWLVLGYFRKMLPMSNLRVVVEGVDPAGRKFRGLYTEADARYLVESNRLNKIVEIKSDIVDNQ